MKLPIAWIAAAFASGILLMGVRPFGQGLHLAALTAATVAAIAIGALLAWRNRTTTAWICALLAWCALGALATGIERAAVPANHATRLIADGKLDTGTPLRWQGRLRSDPLLLPWGRRYEVDLEQMESAAGVVPIKGGLRLNLYGRSEVLAGTAASTADSPVLRAGDRVEALVRARPPRDFLDPGAFDARGYLAGQGIDLTGSLRSAQLLQLVDRPAPTLAQRLARVRGDLLARLDSAFRSQPEQAALLRAMLLGDRSFVDSETVVAFQKTAAYHVLVVAGLHVGALAAIIFWLCRRLRFSIAITSLITFAALAAYVGVVQDRPPILRAALMAGLYLIARPLVRRIDLLNTVALAALVLLVWKPSSLTDPSFDLSFLAAVVIAGLALPWMDRSSAPYRAGLSYLGDVTRDSAHPPRVAQFRIELRAASARLAALLPQWLAPHAQALTAAPVRVGLRLWEIALLSLVIQWGMLPVLAQDFHRVSLAGPLSNVPAVLLTGLIVPLGFLMLAATFVWTRLAAALAHVLAILSGWLLATVGWFSRLPRVSYRIPQSPLWLLLLFFAMFVLLASAARAAASNRKNRRTRRQLPAPIALTEWLSGAALAVLTIFVAWHPFAPSLERGKLEVSVLDVGQGDSIFTAFPGGRTMLIDGGGLDGSERVGGYQSGTDVGEEVVSPYLWSRGLKRLDVVALTHAHHDHLDGLRSVLANFQVGELWIGRDEETPALRSLLQEARTRGVAIVHRTAGSDFAWDGVQGEVLWPPDIGPVAEASNDDSLVMRLSDGDVRFLLPGDAQQKAEDSLVARGAPLNATFLKVPHHGSKTSSTENFLSAVHPQAAVVSVGEGNAYGQPAENILERYAAAGVRLLRTDRDGAVTAVTDGRSLSVHSFVEQQH